MRTSLRRSRRQINAAGSAPVFDPATLALTGWWRGSYAGSPWAGTTSAGSSNGRSLSEATNPPAVGTAVNGFAPASFDAVNDLLNLPGTLDTFVAPTVASGWLLARMNADSNPVFGDNSQFFLWTNGTGNFRLEFASGGAAVRAYSTLAWQLITFRYDGVHSQIGVNEAPGAAGGASSVAYSTAMTPLTGTCSIPYGGGQVLNGQVLEFALADVALTDSDFANVKAYVNSRYGLSL